MTFQSGQLLTKYSRASGANGDGTKKHYCLYLATSKIGTVLFIVVIVIVIPVDEGGGGYAARLLSFFFFFLFSRP